MDSMHSPDKFQAVGNKIGQCTPNRPALAWGSQLAHRDQAGQGGVITAIGCALVVLLVVKSHSEVNSQPQAWRP
jgi:hypothetical protein